MAQINNYTEKCTEITIPGHKILTMNFIFILVLLYLLAVKH